MKIKYFFSIIVMIFTFFNVNAQTTLFFQGFENAGLTCTENWGYTGGNRDNTYRRTGTWSGRVGQSGTSALMTFNTVNVSGMAGLNLQLFHSVRGGTGPGMDVREGAIIRVSLNGGAYTTIGRVGGSNDHSYGWANLGGVSPIACAAPNNVTYQTPNALNYAIPAGTNTIALQVMSIRVNTGSNAAARCTNFVNMMNSANPTPSLYDRTDEGFHIDDVRITTTSTTFTNVWLGTTSQDWNVCSNWSLGIVPTAAHNVLINQSGTIANNCRVFNANAVCNNLTLTTANANTQDLEVRNNRTLTIGGNAIITRTGNGTGNLKFEAQDGGIINIAGTLTATINAGITTAAEIELQTESNGQINVTGNVSFFNNAASTNPFIWMSVGAAGGVGTFNCNNLTLDGNGTTNVNNTRVQFFAAGNHNFEVRGDFLMRDNARFNATNATAATSIRFRGNYTNNVSEAQMLEGNNSRFTFNGAANQTINTNGFNEVFNSMTVTKTGGNVLLADPLEIKSNLTFTTGDVNSTLANLLIFRAGSNHTFTSNNSHTNGPVRKIGNTAFTFPVGNGTFYRNIAISAPGLTTDHFTAQFFPVSPDAVDGVNPAVIEVPISNISDCEHWILDRTNGNSNVFVTLSYRPYGANGCSGVTDPVSLRVARWDAVAQIWRNHGGTGTGPTTGTITTAAVVTAFSPFALATITNTNALPVELILFNATPQESSVLLDWTTASEINVSHFDLQRSKDGENFEFIGKVLSEGNSSFMKNYNFTDYQPLHGTSFYRLNSVDNDGSSDFSEVKTVKFENNVFDANLSYQDQDWVIDFNSTNEVFKEVNLEVFDMSGRKLMSLQGVSNQDLIKVHHSEFPAGNYLIKINSESDQTVFKAVKF